MFCDTIVDGRECGAPAIQKCSGCDHPTCSQHLEGGVCVDCRAARAAARRAQPAPAVPAAPACAPKQG